MSKLVFCFLFLLVAHGLDALLKEGAFKSEYGENSYTVAIYEKIDQVFEQKCSGAILGAQFILTAAHCFFDSELILRKSRFRVITGTDDILEVRTFQEEYEIGELRIPNLFFVNTADVALLSNIAVVKLKTPIKSYRSVFPNRYVQKIELPGSNDLEAKSNPVISGFGLGSMVKIQSYGYDYAIKVKEENYGVLYHADAKILSLTECQTHFSSREKLLTFLHICARVIPRIPGMTGGTCQKDAGAPLVRDGHIIGVLSDGPKNCNETVSPGIYTRIFPHNEFILKAMDSTVTDSTIVVINLSAGVRV